MPCGLDGFENYFDDQRVRDYVFNPEALPKDDIIYNFTLSEENAFLVAEENPKIKEYLESGVLLFVENHIVENSPKFVEDGEEGYILTDYALTHMDECALRFYTRVEILPNEAGCGSLSRKNGGNSVAYCQLDEKLSVEDMLKEDYLHKVQIGIGQMTGTFQDNLRYIMRENGFTQEDLAEILNIGNRTVSRMFAADYEPTRDVVIRICLAFRLPWLVSEQFLKSAGFVLDEREPGVLLIIQVITYCISYSYSKKLEILQNNNVHL